MNDILSLPMHEKVKYAQISNRNEEYTMKQCKRFLGFVIAICLIVSFVPVISATETENVTTYGAAVGVGSSAIQGDSYLVYGKDGTQWYVLDDGFTTTGTEGIAVISKDIVDANIAFNKGGLDNSWANSDAKLWNSEYAAEAFSAAELSAIMETTKAEEAGTYFGANWSKDALAAEKLFFLSAAEVEDYFSDSVEGLIASCEDVADGWWLRSAYTDRDIYGGIVSDKGFVGYPHIAATWGARPAYNIAEDQIVISSAAVGGKVSGSVGADCLTPVAESTSNEWKLTVIDDSHSSFTATIADGSGTVSQNIGYDSWVIPVTYSGAVAGENEYVSVLICNQVDNAVYYGHIAENSASGTVDINMPTGMSGKYTIYVFAEKCNGDNTTDFGSPLVAANIEINDGLASVNSWGLTLEGDIRADFLLNLSDAVIADPDSYIRVEVDGVVTETKVSDITPEDGLYRIITNVAAAQMTEDIVIQVVTSELEGSELLYSVRKYGDYLLKNSEDEKVINLVKSMLNYGGKAQDYFIYNMGNKADNGISIVSNDIPYTEGLAAKKTGSSENVVFYGASLVHEHQTGIRFYFTSTDTAIANVTFSTEGNDDMPVYKVDGRYYVEITDIAPHNLCNEITVTVDGLSVTYSPFYYMHRQYYRSTTSATLRNLMLAMYNYYYYADAYLAN